MGIRCYKIMSKSNSTSGSEAIDYYSIVSRIRPRRSPSIFHKEYQYYWSAFPQAPVYTIFNTTFHKITPLSHCVDSLKYGQIHHWIRVGSIFCPALLVTYFSPPNCIVDVRFYFFAGRIVDKSETGSAKILAPDEELFCICLSGFLKNHLSENFYFDDTFY